MLFLVISTPRRSAASRELAEARLAFREWVGTLKKRVICFYPREDRGAVVIFDLRSRRELERMLRAWRTFVGARLDVYPLQDPEATEMLLKKALRRFEGKE